MSDVLSFHVDWYDQHACLTRNYLLFCYPDNTVEMFDKKTNKKFLKRSVVEGIGRNSFYVGAMMTIFSRQMKVVGYGNMGTCKTLEVVNQRTMGLVKPDAINKLGKIIDFLIEHNMRLTKVKMVKMTKDHVQKFYSQLAGQSCLPALVTFLTSGPVVAFEMIGPNAVTKWHELMGPKDPVIARIKAPLSVRAQFGTDTSYNAVHGSDSPEAAVKELGIFFPPPDEDNSRSLRTTATCRDCTCVIIQPHIIREGKMGKILTQIQDNGFQVSGMEMFNMTQANAMEFYEIYKGVVNEYMGMIEQMCSGPCLVLELVGFGIDTVNRFRCLAGCRQVDAAKELYPQTIRAKFAHSNVENAVHCTDLEDDGEIDSGYFFRTLQMGL